MDDSMDEEVACDRHVEELADTCKRGRFRGRLLGFPGRDVVEVDKGRLRPANGEMGGLELGVAEGDGHTESETPRLLQHHVLMLLAGMDPAATRAERRFSGQA